MRIRTVALIILTILFTGWVITLPVAGAEMKTINVNVYEGINQKGNPVSEQPHDGTEFPHFVTYTVRVYKTDAKGSRLGPYYEKVDNIGFFPASNMFANQFPLKWGMPYESGVRRKCMFWGLHCWYEQEVGFYHIQPVNIPQGYCPFYPDGQDFKKGDTTTIVMKYYYGEECNNGALPTPDPNRRSGGVIIIR